VPRRVSGAISPTLLPPAQAGLKELRPRSGPAVGPDPANPATVVPALAVDAGIRYMVFPHISVDISFRYRYAQPNFKFNFTDMHGGASSLSFSPTYNLFSGMMGVAYHF
jgi:hypothetical protein